MLALMMEEEEGGMTTAPSRAHSSAKEGRVCTPMRVVGGALPDVALPPTRCRRNCTCLKSLELHHTLHTGQGTLARMAEAMAWGRKG